MAFWQLILRLHQALVLETRLGLLENRQAFHQRRHGMGSEDGLGDEQDRNIMGKTIMFMGNVLSFHGRNDKFSWEHDQFWWDKC